MNDTVFNNLIVMLARGENESAKHYLSHFPREVRSAPNVRAALANRVQPEVMAAFEVVGPWLLNDPVDETPARVRRALFNAGKRGLSLSELTWRMPTVPLSDRRQALDTMVRTGEVYSERERTAGRPAYRYRLAVFAMPSGEEVNSPDLSGVIEGASAASPAHEIVSDEGPSLSN